MTNNLIVFFFILSFCSTVSQNIDEDQYSGVFTYGNFSTSLTVDINRNEDAKQVFFSSPEQNAYRIPARETRIASDSIQFVLQSDFFRYEFKGAFKGDSLNLKLAIDNKVYPIVLMKNSKTGLTPVQSRDIRFRSDNLLLYGTVYFPDKPNGKAIYLVTSSGNQDRSSSREEALFFARHGYITMHADKRGTGMSDGNWHSASIPELTMDDIQAITYLAETNSLNYNDIGIKGSSQGASKIPYILSEMPDLGFGILVSCPASTLLESDLNYWKNRTRKELPEDQLKQAEKVQRSVFLFISGDLSQEKLQTQLDSAKAEPFMKNVWVPELDSVAIDRKLNYSPLPYFEKTDAPILVIQGSSDEIIPSHSLETIRQLTENENPGNRYVELKKADHAMMFKGESDFPYWPGLHSDYRDEMLEWLDDLELSGK